jgi:hypothetical protein
MINFEVDHALQFRILLRQSFFVIVRSRSCAKGQFCFLYNSQAVSNLLELFCLKKSQFAVGLILFLFDIVALNLLVYMTENLTYAFSIIYI